MAFDDLDQEVNEASQAEEAEGKLSKQYVEDKLMNSVLAGDKQTIEHAEMLQEAANRSIGAFTPNVLFSQLTTNYRMAEQLYGEKLIRLLTGYQPHTIERNVKIPEFRKELKEQLTKHIAQLKEDDLLTDDGIISAKGAELSAIVLVKELDNYLVKDSIGEKTNKKAKHYGERAETRPYRKGDRYKDLHLKRSVHRAIKRQHTTLHPADLVSSEREGKGRVTLIFALDASASMKGEKIETCKKAGITLAHKATQEKDDVGLIVFGTDIKHAVPPTKDFSQLLHHISVIKASRQTDLAGMIERSIELFPPTHETKHLIILTDALPTVGKKPEEETLRAASKARAAGITISLIGVKLDNTGVALAKQLTHIGEGKFNLVKNLDQLGHIVLEDYYAIR